MAVAFVANVGSATYSMATSVAITVPAAGVAAGNLLVLRAHADAAQASPSVADTQGNTWTVRTNAVNGGNSAWGLIFECFVTTTLVSGNTITLTIAKASGSVVIDEWSGVGAFEAAGSVATGASELPLASLTPAAAGLVLGAAWHHVSRAVTTEDTDTDGGVAWAAKLTAAGKTVAQYKLATSAAAQSWGVTLDGSTEWGAVVLAWTEAAGARVPRSTPYPQLLAH